MKRKPPVQISKKLIAAVPRDLIDEAIDEHFKDLAKEDADQLQSFVTTLDFRGEDESGRPRKWTVRVVTQLSTGKTRAGTKDELPIAKGGGSLH